MVKVLPVAALTMRAIDFITEVHRYGTITSIEETIVVSEISDILET